MKPCLSSEMKSLSSRYFTRAVRIIRSKALIICEVSDTGLYDFGWFCWDPDFSIGHITADLISGAMSPLSNECLYSMYRGSLSSSAHSFKRTVEK